MDGLNDGETLGFPLKNGEFDDPEGLIEGTIEGREEVLKTGENGAGAREIEEVGENELVHQLDCCPDGFIVGSPDILKMGDIPDPAGDTLGVIVGDDDVMEGIIEGILLGKVDGLFEGVPVGAKVGATEGMVVGEIDGSWDGDTVGEGEGIVEG